MVTGDPYLRFYAGVPLSGPGGQKIGTLCLLDLKPREFSAEQMAGLMAFAALVEREVNLGEIIQTQNDLLNARQQIMQMQQLVQRDFDDAVKYVRSMLPPPLSGPISIDWEFLPSVKLGGDGLGYRRIHTDQLAFYVLDVTGHGLGSALLAVSALELLRSRAVRDLDFARPAQVVERLNRTFQMKNHGGKFFSIWYGVYSRAKRQITYASAGHPPALLFTEIKGIRMLTETPSSGPALGVLPEIQITENILDFPPGSQLCIFTDGLYEIVNEEKDHGSYKEFLHRMGAAIDAGQPLYESMQEWLRRARIEGRIDDDVTLLRVLSRSK
jgi:sigma-B regulation protein RsbU (phosphoserine phosphatase)